MTTDRRRGAGRKARTDPPGSLDRRRFLQVLAALTAAGTAARADGEELRVRVLARAERLLGLEFTGEERRLMLEDLADLRESYARLREVPLANSVLPALRFDPVPPGSNPPRAEQPPSAPWKPPAAAPRPGDLEELAFAGVGQLAALLRAGAVSSRELTEMVLARLRRLDPGLEAVITLTEELALEQAARADRDLAEGRDHGPLHGLPWGAKDLLAVRGYPTTWGAAPYRDQVLAEDATVVLRLERAGAVLAAKLSLGALAWGDVWFGGTTRNPWNPEQGSSGSSAGPAAAVAAGLVTFAIGSETWGSIVSPSARCGVTGLRPTFGRVSRHGAMALSWTMDKLGPMARSVEDCALVLEAVAGHDRADPTTVPLPFRWDPALDPRTVRLGFARDLFEAPPEGEGDDGESAAEERERDFATLEVLRGLGFDPVALTLPDLPVDALSLILSCEAAAAFDELTRSGRDDLLVRQERNAWPNVFRWSRFIPAVEYIQANRVRTLLLGHMEALFSRLDVYVAPSFGGHDLLLTNLTGHPSVTVPNGFRADGTPTSITFTGRLFGENQLLAVARAYQEATGFHLRHPAL